MQTDQSSAKALTVATATLISVIALWIITGTYDSDELATTITGFASAALAWWVANRTYSHTGGE